MLLGYSWMSNAITAMFTGNQYPDVEAMALALSGAGSMDAVDEVTLIAVHDALAEKIIAGEGTVQIVLDKPFPAALGILALPFGSSILDMEWAVAQGAWPGTADSWIDYFKPALEEDPLFAVENGSGPFAVEEWNRAEKKLVLKRFAGYWAGPAKLERVVLRSVPEWTTRLLQLEAGDADVVAAPVEFLEELEAKEGIQVIRGLPMVSTTNVFFLWPVRPDSPAIGSGELDGEGVPPDFFADIDVRKGFCYAMDYEALIDQIHLGSTIRARGPIVKGIMGYHEDSPVYELDLDKAAEHFKRAHGGELWQRGFKLTGYYIAGITSWQSALQILQQNLARINPKFRLEVQGLQWSAFADLLWGGADPGAALVVCNWGPDYSDPGGAVGCGLLLPRRQRGGGRVLR
ncbi:MAG: ABC transporter substrate-binding protein [Candidatus Bipolaricaulaceae bacterium]